MSRIAHCSCGSLRAEVRRAGACGRVSLYGVPAPHRLALRRQHVFPERAGAHRWAEQGLRAQQRLGAKPRRQRRHDWLAERWTDPSAPIIVSLRAFGPRIWCGVTNVKECPIPEIIRQQGRP